MRAGQGWAEPVAEALAARKRDQARSPRSSHRWHPRGVASLGHGPRPDAHHDPCPSSPMPLNPAAKTLGGLCFQLLRGRAKAATELQGAPSQRVSPPSAPQQAPLRAPSPGPGKARQRGARTAQGPDDGGVFPFKPATRRFIASLFLKRINTIDFRSWKKYPRGERPWSLCPAKRLRDPREFWDGFKLLILKPRLL